jgi:hypothetical protein
LCAGIAIAFERREGGIIGGGGWFYCGGIEVGGDGGRETGWKWRGMGRENGRGRWERGWR